MYPTITTPHLGPPFSSVCCSENFQYLNVSNKNSQSNSFYKSNDFGNTFTNHLYNQPYNGNNGYLYSAMSGTGQYQMTISDGNLDINNIYLSTNYGVTWNPLSFPTNGNISTCSLSSTGQYQMVVQSGNHIYFSNDYGATFFQNPVLQPLITGKLIQGCAVSGNGQLLTLGVVYSINQGQTWNSPTNIPSGLIKFNVISSCYTGQYQITSFQNLSVSFKKYIFITNDYGQTWNLVNIFNHQDQTQNNINWTSVTISKSGKYMDAVCSISGGPPLPAVPQYLYCYSSDYGNTWNSKNLLNNTQLNGIAST